MKPILTKTANAEVLWPIIRGTPTSGNQNPGDSTQSPTPYFSLMTHQNPEGFVRAEVVHGGRSSSEKYVFIASPTHRSVESALYALLTKTMAMIDERYQDNMIM